MARQPAHADRRSVACGAGAASDRGRRWLGAEPRYSRAALQHTCERIEGAPAGQQDQTLNREAYSIGRLIGAGLMPRQLAIDCIVYSGMMMSNAPGRRRWCEREVQQKVARAVRAGELRPREVPV